MIEIKQITTLEKLYFSHGALTGNVFVDAVVWLLIHDKGQNEVSKIADLLEVNRSTLTDVFQILVGIPLKEAIISWRLWEALDLMDANPTMSAEEVAQRCGFRRAQALGALFKKHFHTTIGAYREDTVRRNGNYDYNQTARQRQEVIDNAKILHDRWQIYAPKTK